MTDENYYKKQADAMKDLLARLVDNYGAAGGGNMHTRYRIMAQVKSLVSDYEKHEATSGKDTFQNLARSIGADPDWYGATVEWPITINGKTIVSRYRISGINPTKPVNKIMLTSSRGKVRWTSVVQVMEQLGESLTGVQQERKRAIQV